MICAQIRRCRRLIPEAAQVAVVAHDYDAGRAEPECDWADAGARADLVDALVGDALAVLDAVEGVELDEGAADAVGYATTIKPISRRPLIAGGYGRGDFLIDTAAGTVTCPAEHTVAIRAAAVNLTRLVNLGLTRHHGQFTLQTGH